MYEQITGVSETTKHNRNTRLEATTKVIKCIFCDTLETLKPYNNTYICTSCIEFVKENKSSY